MNLFDFLLNYDGRLTIIKTDSDFLNAELLYCDCDVDDILSHDFYPSLQKYQVHYFCIQRVNPALNVYVQEI